MHRKHARTAEKERKSYDIDYKKFGNEPENIEIPSRACGPTNKGGAVNSILASMKFILLS